MVQKQIAECLVVNNVLTKSVVTCVSFIQQIHVIVVKHILFNRLVNVIEMTSQLLLSGFIFYRSRSQFVVDHEDRSSNLDLLLWVIVIE